MKNDKITVSVLFFASYKQLLGVSELNVELENGAIIADLCRKLLENAKNNEKWQQVFASETSLKIACNQTLCDPDKGLQQGDQVAFFPPVTGG
ncbi:MAG: MoaD/ThiS family protein [Enterobacterales bacterium]|nr:MoaD/ThiS family protein [Enterobacterales bacterium]